MMQLVALAMVAGCAWRCLGLNRWIYIGRREQQDVVASRLRRRALAKKIKAGKRAGVKVTAESSSSSDDENDETVGPAAPELAWYDQSWLCCCLWPLCWTGTFSSGWTGRCSSCGCRMAGLFARMFCVVVIVAMSGVIAKIAAERDLISRPGNQTTFSDIWQQTVARKMAVRQGEL